MDKSPNGLFDTIIESGFIPGLIATPDGTYDPENLPDREFNLVAYPSGTSTVLLIAGIDGGSFEIYGEENIWNQTIIEIPDDEDYIVVDIYTTNPEEIPIQPLIPHVGDSWGFDYAFVKQW